MKILLFIIICSIILITGSLIVRAQVEIVKIPDPLDCDGHCDLGGIIAKVTEFLKIIAIPLATIIIIISGIQYLTSLGNEERVSRAKKTLLYTIIGLAVVLLVDFIVDLLREILGKI